MSFLCHCCCLGNSRTCNLMESWPEFWVCFASLAASLLQLIFCFYHKSLKSPLFELPVLQIMTFFPTQYHNNCSSSSRSISISKYRSIFKISFCKYSSLLASRVPNVPCANFCAALNPFCQVLLVSAGNPWNMTCEPGNSNIIFDLTSLENLLPSLISWYIGVKKFH